MRLSILLPVVLKYFIIASGNNENIPAINIADDEIICHYLSLPLFSSALNRIDLGEYNNNAYIIKKKSEYNCGIQIKLSNYNKFDRISELQVEQRNDVDRYINYEILYLSAIKKEECINNPITYCDHYAFCDVNIKKTMCCDTNYCNSFDNIISKKDVYLFNEKRFSNNTTNATCVNRDNTSHSFFIGSTIQPLIDKRKTASCIIITSIKKENHSNSNNTTSLKITNAKDQAICKFCNFPIFTKLENYDRDYQEKCEDEAFIIIKKSKYSCGFFLESKPILFENIIVGYASEPRYNINIFISGAINKKNCLSNIITSCQLDNICRINHFICDNENNYRNIIFDSDVYLYAEKKFLKYTHLPYCSSQAYSIKLRICTIMKINTNKSNEFPTIQDQNKKNCECNFQDKVNASYLTLLILTFYSFIL